MGEAWLELDTDLRERLREVLDDPSRPVTEAEFRALQDEGRACRSLMGAELERLESRLARFDSDPESSLAPIAEVFRRVRNFRAHIEELEELMAAFEARAREVHTSWQRKMVRQP
jgi:chromosome segregation ATPase